MLKKNFKILAIILVVISIIFSCSFVLAAEDEPATKSENLKQEDLYLNGDNITVNEMVDGNVFAIGNKVTISSEVGGDAFIVAKEVSVEDTGYVNGNIFVVANNVNVKGLAYNVYAVSDNVTVSGYIYRDLKVISNQVNIYGTIGRDVFSNTSNISFKAPESTVSNEGIISGNLNYSGENESIASDSSNVAGKVTYSKVDNPITKTKGFTDYLFELVCLVIFVVLVYLLLLKLTPKFTSNVGKEFISKFVPSILIGLLALVIIPVIALLFVFFRVTVLAGLVLSLLYLLLLAISTCIFIIALNAIVCGKFKITAITGKIFYLILVTTVVWLISLIPFVKPYLFIISALIGLGLIFTYLCIGDKTTQKKAKPKSATN